MFLIKSCPSCKNKLRFPIDKGKLRINCICGYTFIADPDDKNLYLDSVFDLQKTTRKSIFADTILKLKRYNYRESLNSIINAIFQYKYSIQNFRISSVSEQKRIILSIIKVIIAVLLFLITIIFIKNFVL
jgi:hypothetical protein